MILLPLILLAGLAAWYAWNETLRPTAARHIARVDYESHARGRRRLRR